MEKYSAQLVALLEGCLQHDLKPTRKDEHPPHAKVAADVMSCIFLVSRSCVKEAKYFRASGPELES